MKNFSQKIPLAVSIGRFTTQQVSNGLSGIGQIYPCRVITVGVDGAGNSIVTVNFEIYSESSTGVPLTFPPVTMPIASSQYVQLPIQIGDAGIAIAASVRLGGISGLGVPNSLAPLTTPSNLGALVFMPISNALWTPPVNPEALVLQGIGGVVMQDMEGLTTSTLTPAGLVVNAQTSITFSVGTNSVTINASGINIQGALKINGTAFTAHAHTGVTPGTGITGGTV